MYNLLIPLHVIVSRIPEGLADKTLSEDDDWFFSYMSQTEGNEDLLDTLDVLVRLEKIHIKTLTRKKFISIWFNEYPRSLIADILTLGDNPQSVIAKRLNDTDELLQVYQLTGDEMAEEYNLHSAYSIKTKKCYRF